MTGDRGESQKTYVSIISVANTKLQNNFHWSFSITNGIPLLFNLDHIIIHRALGKTQIIHISLHIPMHERGDFGDYSASIKYSLSEWQHWQFSCVPFLFCEALR